MRLILVLISLLISFQLHGENDCERKNSSLSSEDIKRIISNHNIWLGKKERSENDPLYANLCGHDLSKMSLAGVNLRSADLRRTILSFTNFKGSDLNNADLSGAILRNADLSYTSLIGANFEKADLGGANLEAADLRQAMLHMANLNGANLNSANLYSTTFIKAGLGGASLRKTSVRETDFYGADLSGATFANAVLTNAIFDSANLSDVSIYDSDLSGVEFKNAYLINTIIRDSNINDVNFRNADLTGLIYEPKEIPLPNISSLAWNQTLDKMKFAIGPESLVALRKAFYNASYLDAGKKITKILRKDNATIEYGTDFTRSIEILFNLIFFEWTTDWGTKPGRALQILSCGIILFMFFYLVALQAPEEKNGIWKIRGSDRLQEANLPDIELVVPKGFVSSLIVALYFSVLSAFHFGWRDLNVGSWILRLQNKEYSLRATGWVRTTSGAQSLLSIYLVAIWAITYFGRPFD